MYEQEREQLLHKAKSEMEESEQKQEKIVGQLKEEMAAVHKDRDESLLMAENDKQQVMSDRRTKHANQYLISTRRTE